MNLQAFARQLWRIQPVDRAAGHLAAHDRATAPIRGCRLELCQIEILPPGGSARIAARKRFERGELIPNAAADSSGGRDARGCSFSWATASQMSTQRVTP